MSLKTLLCHLDPDGSAEKRVAFAGALAQHFSAGLIGFSAADVHTVMPAADGAIIDGTLIAREAEEIERAFVRLKEAFAAAAQYTERTEWRTALADPTRSLALQARAADLIVTAASDAGGDRHQTVDLGELVLACGRPVLVMADGAQTLKAQIILIAWKDSREARRAVADALPFLKEASDVLVVTLADHDRAAARMSAGDVVHHLKAHGVTARFEIAGHEMARDADTLARIAGTMEADLIVSGAYGHSRLREWAFGGMTRDLIADGRFNRLFTN